MEVNLDNLIDEIKQIFNHNDFKNKNIPSQQLYEAFDSIHIMIHLRNIVHGRIHWKILDNCLGSD